MFDDNERYLIIQYELWTYWYPNTANLFPRFSHQNLHEKMDSLTHMIVTESAWFQ